MYRYFYSRPRPAMRPEKGTTGAALGAAHSAEIEYALGNLATNEVYAWTPDDYKVSETFQGYIENFVKTGDPNGAGLPAWRPFDYAESVPHVQSLAPGIDGIKPVDYATEHKLDFWSSLP